MTSSAGRLFDAVAALIGIRQQVNYEAQAAIELEMAMGSEDDPNGYRFDLLPEGDAWIIGARPLFEAIVNDVGKNVSVGVISRRFHNGLVDTFAELASRLSDKTGLTRVCLSGGTFYNVYLSGRLEERLSKSGFEVFTQREVPAGDGGLSLGQALVAASRFKAMH